MPKFFSWQGLHNAITTESNRELFDTDLIVLMMKPLEYLSKMCHPDRYQCVKNPLFSKVVFTTELRCITLLP